MANINDVAQAAGVSTATVSRTFANPNLLNAQTHDRVVEVARQMNYRPRRRRTASGDAAAKNASVAVSSGNAIGFQFFAASSTPGDTLFSNTFYSSVLAGAMDEASKQGLHLLVHTTNQSAFRNEVPRMVLEKAIGGMLLVGIADPEIIATLAQHIPNIVVVGNCDTTGAYESVISDGFGGAYAAARHLLDLGHRHIGFYLSKDGVPSFQDRLRGYRCALLEAGIFPDEKWIVRGAGAAETQQKKRLADSLCSANRPTALITDNDNSALKVLSVCRAVSITVPDDLSIIGFDDIAHSRYSQPALTTVGVPKEQIGRVAVRRLCARLREEAEASAKEQPVCHKVPVKLVLRESCAPVKKRGT